MEKVELNQNPRPDDIEGVPRRFHYILVGVLLGIVAPVGILLIRIVFSAEAPISFFKNEVKDYYFFYLYSAITTPIIFASFGYIWGRATDSHIALNRKLLLESRTDDLTGQYNHRHILVEIDHEIERAQRYKRPLTAMMLDLDEFKQVNDSYGHLTGDHVLRFVSDRISSSIRSIDILGRFGGDEFIIILPEADRNSAKIISDRILKEINAETFVVGRHRIHVTISIGVYSMDANETADRITFIEKADQALISAKKCGKNTISFAP